MATPVVTPDPILDTPYETEPLEPRSGKPPISRNFKLDDDFAIPPVPPALQTPPVPVPPAPVADVTPPPVPEVPPVPPPPAPDGQPPVKLRRTIDLKDGSGVQVFEAEGPTLEAAQDALLEKLQSAQENATRKIRELRDKAKSKPDRTTTFKPVQLAERQVTEEELAQLKQTWDKDPVAGFRQLQEIVNGVKAQDLVQAVQQTQSQQMKNQLDTWAVEFVSDHLEDFDNTAPSAFKITEFLRGCTRPVTEGGFACPHCKKTHDPELIGNRNNLEYAFEQLTESGVSFMASVPQPPAPVPAPPVAPPAPVPPAPIAAPAPPVPPAAPPVSQTTPPPPVTLSDRSGQRPPVPTEMGGVDVTDFSKLSTRDMKARIGQLARTQQTGSR